MELCLKEQNRGMLCPSFNRFVYPSIKSPRPHHASFGDEAYAKNWNSKHIWGLFFMLCVNFLSMTYVPCIRENAFFLVVFPSSILNHCTNVDQNLKY